MPGNWVTTLQLWFSLDSRRNYYIGPGIKPYQPGLYLEQRGSGHTNDSEIYK